MSEMNNNRIKVSAGALILAALIYYTADFGTLACVAVPVLIHELGHIVCLRLLGLRICGFKAELRGLCMGYAGCTSGFGRILAAAAGPAAGGLYALIASYAGKIYGSDWLLCSAGVSVILTAFNLLPALPLDGGQIFAELAAAAFGGRRGMRLAELTGLLTGTLLLAAGLWLMWTGRGAAVPGGVHLSDGRLRRSGKGQPTRAVQRPAAAGGRAAARRL